MANDVRKEQVSLLRFEKLLTAQATRIAKGKNADRAAIAAGLTGLAATSAVVSEKFGDQTPSEYIAQAQDVVASNATISGEVLVHIAEIIGKTHALAESLALQTGFAFLQVDGTPKEEPPAVVMAILGL